MSLPRADEDVRRSMVPVLPVGWPSFAGQPLLPPQLSLVNFLLPLRRKVRARFRDRRQWLESHCRPQCVDVFRVGEPPGANAAIARVVQPLRAEALRTSFMHGDAVFQVSGMPGGSASLSGGHLHKAQCIALEVRLPNRMLRDDPCGFSSVLTSDVFGGPAVLRDQLTQARSILDVDLLHTRNIRASEFAGFHEFISDLHIVLAHGDEFAAEVFVDHARILMSA